MRGKGLIIAFVMLMLFSGAHAFSVSYTFSEPVLAPHGYTNLDYPMLYVTISGIDAPIDGTVTFDRENANIPLASFHYDGSSPDITVSIPVPPPMFTDSTLGDGSFIKTSAIHLTINGETYDINVENLPFAGGYFVTMYEYHKEHKLYVYDFNGIPTDGNFFVYDVQYDNGFLPPELVHSGSIAPVSYVDFNVLYQSDAFDFSNEDYEARVTLLEFNGIKYPAWTTSNYMEVYEDYVIPHFTNLFYQIYEPGVSRNGNRIRITFPYGSFYREPDESIPDATVLRMSGANGEINYYLHDPIIEKDFEGRWLGDEVNVVFYNEGYTYIDDHTGGYVYTKTEEITLSAPITATANVYYTVEPTTCSPLYHYSVRIGGEGTHSVEIRVRNDDLNINYLLHSSTEDLPVEINGDILYSLPPSSYPPYYLDIIVDENTVLSKAFEVIAPASITVNNVYAPGSYTHGDTVPVTVELKNTGDLECSESVTVEIKNGEGNIIATNTLSANVPANSEVNVTTTFTVNEIEPLHVYVNGTERTVIEYDPPEAEVEAEAGLYDPYDINSGIHYEVTVTGRGDYNVSVEIFDPVSNDSIPLYNGIVTANPTATIEDTVFPALEVNRSYYLRVFVDGSLKAAVPFVYDSAYAPATIVSAKLDRNYYEPGSTATLSLNVDYPGNKGYVSLYIDENYLKSVYFHGEKFKLVSFTVPEPLGGHVLKVEGNNSDVLIFYSVENPQSYGEGTVNYTEAVASFFNNPALLILVIVLGISIYLAIEFGFSILLTAGGLLFLFGIFGVIPLGYGIGGLVLALIDIMLRRRE